MSDNQEKLVERYIICGKFKEALNLEPTGWFAYETCLKMGLCFKELGNIEKALKYYERGKKLGYRSSSKMHIFTGMVSPSFVIGAAPPRHRRPAPRSKCAIPSVRIRQWWS